MTTKHPHRLRNFDYVGRFHYSLTWCCHERKCQFVQPDRVALVWRQILRAAGETRFEIVVYSFMPDHLHLLVRGIAPSSDAREFIRKAKQYAGFYFNQEYRERLWQRNGYDSVLLTEGAIRAAMDYIIANPVRAGIAKTPEAYRFTGSQVFTIAELIADLTGRGRL